MDKVSCNRTGGEAAWDHTWLYLDVNTWLLFSPVSLLNAKVIIKHFAACQHAAEARAVVDGGITHGSILNGGVGVKSGHPNSGLSRTRWLLGVLVMM